jgi:L-ascorbate metabolism protein UlaG (beta-lactamase superfamily)
LTLLRVTGDFVLSNMGNTQIQLLGHATFKVITPEGKIIIVDPWLIDNPFIPDHCKQQDQIDLMLITHGHDDHFDIQIASIIEKTKPTIVANPICRWYLLEKGVDNKLFEPMNIGGTISSKDVKISMVNALHLSHINEVEDKAIFPHDTVGFVIELSDGIKIYFAGDTGIFSDMQLIGEINKPTIAVIPIGDRYTMGPLEASYAIKLLNVKQVIPFHYGTYPSLTGTPEALRKLCNENVQILELKAGEIFNCKNSIPLVC